MDPEENSYSGGGLTIRDERFRSPHKGGGGGVSHVLQPRRKDNPPPSPPGKRKRRDLRSFPLSYYENVGVSYQNEGGKRIANWPIASADLSAGQNAVCCTRHCRGARFGYSISRAILTQRRSSSGKGRSWNGHQRCCWCRLNQSELCFVL